MESNVSAAHREPWKKGKIVGQKVPFKVKEMYWAQELAAQKDDPALAKHFAALAETLVANEKKIVDELRHVQGKPADIGGYYKADFEKVKVVMRPSPTFNAALAAVS